MKKFKRAELKTGKRNDMFVPYKEDKDGFSDILVKKSFFEIKDTNASLNEIGLEKLREGKTLKLSDVLEHKELFDRVPSLRDINVSILEDECIGYGGFYQESLDLIRFKDKNKMGVILHEIQHAIQDRYEWPQGSNPEYFSLMKEKEKALRSIIKKCEKGLKRKNRKKVSFENKWLKKQKKAAELAIYMKRKAIQPYLATWGEMQARAVTARYKNDYKNDSWYLDIDTFNDILIVDNNSGTQGFTELISLKKSKRSIR